MWLSGVSLSLPHEYICPRISWPNGLSALCMLHSDLTLDTAQRLTGLKRLTSAPAAAATEVTLCQNNASDVSWLYSACNPATGEPRPVSSRCRSQARINGEGCVRKDICVKRLPNQTYGSPQWAMKIVVWQKWRWRLGDGSDDLLWRLEGAGEGRRKRNPTVCVGPCFTCEIDSLVLQSVFFSCHLLTFQLSEGSVHLLCLYPQWVNHL